MAKSQSWVRVLSLSPEWPLELVNPAASLPFQPWSSQIFALASMNVLNTAEPLPM